MKTATRLKVKLKDGRVFEGFALPKTEFSGDVLILKLDNGYNVGLNEKEIDSKEIIETVNLPEAPKLKITGKGSSVSFIGTGGTISSKVDYLTGGVGATMGAEEIVALVPEVADFAEIKFVDLMKKLSEDMVPKNWTEMAKTIYNELKKSEGVVILHGTDTLHYTSSAISFMIDTFKPIVFTGAQRSSDRPSTDAALNILASVHTAKSPIAESVICFHGSTSDNFANVIRGNRARKMHTSERAAFKSINYPPLARVWSDGRFEKTAEFFERSEGEAKLSAKVENKVAIVRVFPGADPDVLRYYQSKGYKGVVIEGTGLGHVPVNPDNNKSWIPVVKEVLEDMSVVVTSQTIYGRTHKFVYTNLRKLSQLGVLMVEDMITETAYTKLAWALGNFDRQKAEEKMLENLKGEMSLRTIQ